MWAEGQVCTARRGMLCRISLIWGMNVKGSEAGAEAGVVSAWVLVSGIVTMAMDGWAAGKHPTPSALFQVWEYTARVTTLGVRPSASTGNRYRRCNCCHATLLVLSLLMLVLPVLLQLLLLHAHGHDASEGMSALTAQLRD